MGLRRDCDEVAAMLILEKRVCSPCLDELTVLPICVVLRFLVSLEANHTARVCTERLPEMCNRGRGHSLGPRGTIDFASREHANTIAGSSPNRILIGLRCLFRRCRGFQPSCPPGGFSALRLEPGGLRQGRPLPLFSVQKPRHCPRGVYTDSFKTHRSVFSFNCCC